MQKKRTNWHEAAVCAIQITLRDYESLLEYFPEHALLEGALRIDLLAIRKSPEVEIPHSIAKIFHSYNLFEIKGIHSSVNIPAYYKTVAYASLLIAADPNAPPFGRRDVTLSFLCRRNPKKLIRYLTVECKKTIADPFPGVYYISGEMFPVQIIVTGELPPQEALYLHCLTDRLSDRDLIERLAADYSGHQNVSIYEKYMNQLTNANMQEKGESPMCCEGIFRLYGTSSKEIAEKAAKEAAEEAAKQQALKDAAVLEKITAEHTTELNRLKALLEKHHIAYE